MTKPKFMMKEHMTNFKSKSSSPLT